MMRYLTTLALILMTLAGATQASVLKVKEGESIQDAVNTAKPGDTIEVYPGIYRETV